MTPAEPTAYSLLPSSKVPSSLRPLLDKTLVIIIDDIGYQLRNGLAAVNLPGKINYAVLPHTPYGKRLASKAHKAGKEILLHTPMDNIKELPLGKGGLTTQLRQQEFINTLRSNLDDIPYAKGINNHMGSELTQRHLQMSWVMQELRQRQLYFVDSRTSARTVAADTASEFGVPNISRQIFLDNIRSAEAIDKRFKALLRIVHKEGRGIAIGHPHPETIAYLQQALPRLAAQGIKLAFVSEVLTGRVAHPPKTISLPQTIAKPTTTARRLESSFGF
jgi:polysaccharide deacetylase 2 family uncharacterized protein YibQ